METEKNVMVRFRLLNSEIGNDQLRKLNKERERLLFSSP